MSDQDLKPAALTALRCLDLTQLGDADTPADIDRLAARAATAHGTVAALCVWPQLARHAVAVAPRGVRVAAVANFPAGDADPDRARRDAGTIAQAGAHEVDVVLPWRRLLDGDARTAARVVAAARRGAEGLMLKVILESGELGDEARVAEASRIALGEGADVLKTSTGKTPHGASLAACRTMVAAIVADPGARARVGLKPSGGLRRVVDVLPYLDLVRDQLGADALQPQRLRFGASALLDDILAQLDGRAAPAAAGKGY